MKKAILVSECLLGHCCTYRQDSNRCDRVIDLCRDRPVVAVCPEQMGGLPTPRPPAERQGARVIAITGKDVTREYRLGAAEALRLARESGATVAILKARSPSCGCGVIYDGTFTGTRIPGNGVTAELLLQHGIRVYTEEETEAALAALEEEE